MTPCLLGIGLFIGTLETMFAMIDLAESTIILAASLRVGLELGWAVDEDGTETLVDGETGRGRRHWPRSFQVRRTVRPARVRTGPGADGSGLEDGCGRGGRLGSGCMFDGCRRRAARLPCGTGMGNEGLGTGDGLLVGLGCSSEASDGVAGSSEVFGVEDSGCRGVVGCSCTGTVTEMKAWALSSDTFSQCWVAQTWEAEGGTYSYK